VRDLTPEEVLARMAAVKRVPVRISYLPEGYAGTAVVLGNMVAFARGALEDERVNQLARFVTKDLPARDASAEADALLRFLQETFRYTRLPWYREGWQRLQTVPYTLFEALVRTGECASLATAFASLALSLGLETRFRTAGVDASRPRDFEHVYAIVAIGGEWVAADPSYDQPLGWPHRPGDRSPVAVVQDWPI
jgi:transglutaminase-like putative cysteine protease